MYLNPAIVSDWMAAREADTRRRSAQSRPWARSRVPADASQVSPVRPASAEWARRARFRRQRSPSTA
jgi:hypothetical protein